MWGKLNQMVSGEQQKIDNLESQLQEEQQRNKTINEQFKLVLKEKEKEIQRLKANGGVDDAGSTNGVMDDREEMKEEITKLQRKVEEYQMLNTQKDENVKVLMQQLNEAEELKFQVEAQERVNSEKLMFELAGRIDAHEKISNKLEEVNAVLQQRDVAVAEFADEIAAKDQMLRAKDDAIKKLRTMNPNAGASEDLLETLERSLSEKEREIHMMKSTISQLEIEKNSHESDLNKEQVEELMGMKKSYVSLKDENVQLLQKNEEIETANETLLTSNKEFESKIAELETMLNTFKSEVESKKEQDDQLKEMKESYTFLEDEHTLLQQKNKEVESENNELLSSKNELEGKVAELEAFLTNLQSEVASKKEQAEHMMSELNSTREVLDHSSKCAKELTEMKESYAALRDENLELLQKNEKLESTNTELQERNKKLESDVSDLETSLKKELDQKNVETEKLSFELNAAKERNTKICEELKDVKEALTLLKDENKLLQKENHEMESANKKLAASNKKLKTTISDLETKLKTSLSDVESKKQEAENLKSKLKSANKKLDMSKSNRDENEQALCAEITQLQGDNDSLSKTITDLEATILQLDGDLNASQTDVKKYKVLEDELQEGLNLAKEEKEEVKKQITEMEEVLQTFAGNVNSRRKSRNEPTVECKSDIVTTESLQSSSAGGVGDQKVLTEVLHILEEERVELEQLIQIAVKEKNDVMEKNAHLEGLLTAEKEKFDKVIEKSSKLQAELTEQGLEKNALSTKLEEEISSLNALLKSTEEQCKTLSEREIQMSEYINSLTKDLAHKEEEITNLQQHVEKLDNMREESDAVSLQDRCKLENRIKELETENEELQKTNNGKISECEGLHHALDKEHQVKAEMEKMMEVLKSQCSTFETDAEILKEENSYHSLLSNTLEMKGSELTQNNEALSAELKRKNGDYENLLGLFKEVESKEELMNENMKSKESVMLTLEGDLKGLQGEYNTLLQHYDQVQTDLSNKAESMKFITSSLESKEESIHSLKMQVDTLSEEKETLLKKEYMLNETVANYMVQIDDITIDMKSKEETLDRLTEEILELRKERDLLQVDRDKKVEEFNEVKSKMDQHNLSSQRLKEELHRMEVHYQEESIACNEDLQSRESSLIAIENDMKNLQEKYITLEEHCNRLQTDISAKEEDILAISSNLKSKEEGIKLLLSQIEMLKEEIHSLKTNENTLNSSIMSYLEKIDVITTNLKSKDDSIAKLNEEISEVQAERDLLKINNDKNMDDLMKATSLLDQQNLATGQLKEELEKTERNYQEEHVMLEEDMRKLQEKYGAIQELCNKYQADILAKEENILAVNSTLKSKEESLQLLVNQLETLKQQFDSLKENENTLNMAITTHMNQINDITTELNSREETILTLNADIEELQKERDFLKADLERKVDDLNKAVSLLDQQNVVTEKLKEDLQKTESIEQCTNENLKSKESALSGLGRNLEDLQAKYTVLQDHCKKLEADISAKEEDILAISSNLKSKEESIQVMLNQVEMLSEEKDFLKKNEHSLNTAINNHLQQIDHIKMNLQTKEDEVNRLSEVILNLQKERDLIRGDHDRKAEDLQNVVNVLEEQKLVTENLKEELRKSESNYRDDLIKAEEFSSNLQEQFRKLQESEMALQRQIECKNEELKEIAVQHEEEKALLRNTLSIKDEHLSQKLDEIDQHFQGRLSEKDNEIEKMNAILADLEVLHQQSKAESFGTVEIIKNNLTTKESELEKMKSHVQNLREKDIEWNAINKEKDCILDEKEMQVVTLRSELEKVKMELKEVVEEKVNINIGLVEKESELAKIHSHFETLLEEKECDVNELNGKLKTREKAIVGMVRQLKNVSVEFDMISENRITDDRRTEEPLIVERQQQSGVPNIKKDSVEAETVLSCSELENLQQEVDESIGSIINLQRKLNTSVKEKETIQETLVGKNELVDELKHKLEQSQVELKLLQTEYQNSMQENENEKTSLSQSIEDKSKETDHFKAKASKKLKEMNKEIKAAHAVIKEFETREAQLTKEKEEVKEACDVEVTTLTTELHQVEKTNEDLLNDVEIMKNKVSELEAKSHFEEKASDFENEVGQLKQLLAEKEDQLDEVEKTNEDLLNDIEIMKNKVSELESKSHFEEKARDFENEVHQLKQLLAEKEDQLHEVDKTNEDLLNNMDTMKYKMSELEAKGDFEAISKAFENEVMQLQQLLAEKEDQLHEVGKTNEDLLNDIEIMKNKVSELEAKSHFEEKAKDFENEVDQLKQVLAEKEDQLDEVDKINEDLLNDMDTLKIKISELESKTDFEAKAKDFESEVIQLQQLLAEKEESIVNLSVAVEDNTEHNGILEVLNDVLTSVREQSENIQQKYHELHKALTEKDIEIEKCNSKVDEMENNLAEQSTQCNEMFSDVSKKEEDIALMVERNNLLSSQLSPGEIEPVPPINNTNIDSPLEPSSYTDSGLDLGMEATPLNSEQVVEKNVELRKEMEHLKEIISVKDAECKAMSDSLVDMKQQYQSLKEKSVRNAKKFLAMKKVVAEKENDIQVLKTMSPERESRPFGKVVELDEAVYSALNEENVNNKELVKSLGSDLEHFKMVCKDKDVEINELNNIISQLNEGNTSITSPRGKDESSEGSAPEASVTTSGQELEWDPSDTTKTSVPPFPPIDDVIDDPLSNSMDSVFSDIPRSVSEIQVLIPPTANATILDLVKEEERQKLLVEVEELHQMLNKYKKKSTLQKKAHGELAKEVELLQDLPNELEQKELLLQDLKLQNEKLKLVNKNQREAVVEHLYGVSSSFQGEIDVNIDYKNEDDDESELFQQQLHNIMDILQKEKVDFVNALENEKLNYQRKCETDNMEAMRAFELSIKKESNVEIELLKRELNVIVEKQLEADNDRESERVLKNQALEELEFLREQLSMSILDLQQSRETSQECENKLLCEIERELSEVKGRLHTVTIAKDEMEAVMKCEELLKQQYVKENDILRSELNVFKEGQQQLADSPGGLEEIKKHKDSVIKKLKLKIRKEISDKEVLTNESTRISGLLSEKESIIKNLEQDACEKSIEFDRLLIESTRISSLLLEKDDTIMNLEQDISEKSDEHNKLAVEVSRLSPMLLEKDNIIQNLENEIYEKSDEHEMTVFECTKQIQEKEDLITALKDEVSWLKDSMAPLYTKADNAEKLFKENQNLKFCIETKDNELVHLKENALLKENELTDLIDEEKRNQEEYYVQKEKFRLKAEEKEASIKTLTEEMQWLQSQVDALTPKADQLVTVSEDLNTYKENLAKELSQRHNNEKQLHVMETKISEQEEEIEQWQEECRTLQVQLDDLLSNKEEVEELNTSFKEMEELYSSKSEELLQVNDSLLTREEQLEGLRSEMFEKTNAFEELQGMLQNTDLEKCQMTLLLDQEREVAYRKDELIKELRGKVNEEQEKVSMLTHEISKVNQLLDEKTFECDATIGRVENLEMVNADLQSIAELHKKQKVEIEQITETLQENDAVLNQLKSDNTKICTDLNDLLVQLGRAGCNEDLQVGNIVQIVRETIDENMVEMTRCMNLLQEKEKEINDSNASNCDLLHRMETMRREYENFITQLQESISEKDTLYNNSLQQVKMVKEMLEAENSEENNDTSINLQIMDDSSLQDHDDSGEGWDDAYGWENIDNIEAADLTDHVGVMEEPDNNEPTPEVVTQLNTLCTDKDTTISRLQDELNESISERDILTEKCKEIGKKDSRISTLQDKLNESISERDILMEKCKEIGKKDSRISKLQDKLNKSLSERDILVEKCKEVGNIESLKGEISTLKTNVENLTGIKEQKETTIAKLKLKLKQTIKGRDQLKENLQSELDRLSLEKDMIFNEFSEKLQQQNVELNELRSGSEMFSKTLESVGGECSQKDKELEVLQSTLDEKLKTIENTNASYGEMKIKLDEVQNEKDKLNILVNEKDERLKELESENDQKDYQIKDLEQELGKMKSEIKDFDDLQATFDETMTVKDHSIEKMSGKIEVLQQEYVKLNAESQSSLSKHQNDLDEREEKITSLNEKLLHWQEEKENMSIKVDEYMAELEAVEILFGLSNQSESLIEKVSCWQLETTNKLKEHERNLKSRELDDKNVHLILKDIEKICDVPSDKSSTMMERLRNVQGVTQKWKQRSLKALSLEDPSADKQSTEDVEATAESEDNVHAVTYQILENQIQAFTALTEELQKKMDEVHKKEEEQEKQQEKQEEKQQENQQENQQEKQQVKQQVKGVATLKSDNKENVSYLKKLIEEISSVKLQLHKNISYSKSEMAHAQSENVNLRKQIALLTSRNMEDLSPSQETKVSNVKSFVQLQKSFETVISQKDVLIDSLRKRIGEQNEIICEKSEDNEILRLLAAEDENPTELPAKAVEENRDTTAAEQPPQSDVVVEALALQSDDTPGDSKPEVVEEVVLKEEVQVVTSEKELTEETPEHIETRESLAEAQQQIKILEDGLQCTMFQLESKNKHFEEIMDELRDKNIECNDLIDENNDLKEEVNDLKESLQEMDVGAGKVSTIHLEEQICSLNALNEKYEKEVEDAKLKVSGLEECKESQESRLREKEYLILQKDDDVICAKAEVEEMKSQLETALSDVLTAVTEKEEILKKNYTIQCELTEQQLENTNLKKHLESYRPNEPKSNEESDLRNVISKKNEAFLELRDSFDEVIAQKDSVIDSLRKSVNRYREENLNILQKSSAAKPPEPTSPEKDKKIVALNKQVGELEARNMLMTEELNRIKTERDSIDGRFDDISYSLRSDLELALKDRKEHGDDLKIYCLELERNLKKLEEDASNYDKKLKTKEKLINEKNVVISNLQNQVEDTSEKMGYKILQSRLDAANKDITVLLGEKNDLLQQHSELKEKSASLQMEIDVVRNEKNQLKLESSSYVEDVFIKNAEDLQNLTNSFEVSLKERDAEISELKKSLIDKEEECADVALTQQNLLESKLNDVEENYSKKITDLENQLNDIVSAKEKDIETIDHENIGPRELMTLENDYNSLIKAKDEQMHYMSSQLDDGVVKCTELNETIKDKDDKITSLGQDINVLRREIDTLKETNKKLADTQASDIKQTIITKGKQLRELRDEFEAVFNEKNDIIENMRTAVKSSRDELAKAQEKIRTCHEDIRNFENNMIELESEKTHAESKLSSVLENKTNLNNILLKEQEENQESKAYISDILTENSKLMSTCEELKTILEDTDYSVKEKLAACNCEHLTMENEYLSMQLDATQREFDECRKNDIEKEEKIESLESTSAEIKEELIVLQNVLNSINTIIDNVADLSSYDDLVTGVPKKIEQLVNNFSSSQLYTNELSKKMHDLMEEKPVQDFSCQCDDEGKEALCKNYQDKINYLQKELIQTVDEKENVEGMVREEYDDILENLREDLEESKKGYNLLQEENFSLRNQLDVFTNVYNKGKQASTPVEEVPLESPLSDDAKSLDAEAGKTESAEEISELKTSVTKLKKICRKYKSELQTVKNESKQRNEEIETLNSELKTSYEFSKKEKYKFQHEIKSLREEINVLVVEKDGIVNTFRMRSENELKQMKEMYQISLNKLTHDIQEKNNLIEQYESEVEWLKDSEKLSTSFELPQPSEDKKEPENAQCDTSSSEGPDLLRTIDIMKNEITTLREEKRNCLSQIKSHREEITEFVHERDKMVAAWQSKVDTVNKQKEELEYQLKNEINELSKRLASQGTWEIIDKDVSTNQEELHLLENTSVVESTNVVDDTSVIAKNCENEDLLIRLTDLQCKNEEKDSQLLSYHSAFAELESKLNHEYQVTRSLSENIASLKAKNADLQDNMRKEFENKFQDLVNERNIVEQDLILARKMFEDLCTELHEIKSYEVFESKLEQITDQKSISTNLAVSNDVQSQLRTISDENAQLSSQILSLQTTLDLEVKDHQNTQFLIEETEQNKRLMLNKFKTVASDIKYNLKSMRCEVDSNLSVMNNSFMNYVKQVLPSMIGKEYQDLKDLFREKEEELLHKEDMVSETLHHKKVAESRLLDVVGVLQDLGEIERVQAKLLERESSLKNLHLLPGNQFNDVEELKRSLLEKDAIIAEYEERISRLEDTIHIWRGQYLSEDQMKDNESRVSEVIDWPESDQGSMVSDFGSMFSIGSRPSVAPSTPTMDRN